MYNEGGGAAVGGGAVTAGGLAYTGASVFVLAVVAFALILLGVILVRAAGMKRRGDALTAAPHSVDAFAALASAVAATSAPSR